MIQLQFSTAPGLTSEAIRIFSRGWPSHCDAVLPDGSLLGARSDMIGGQPPGVRIRPAAYEDWSRTLAVQLAAPAPIEQAFLAFLDAQVGKPYDDLAILAFPVERDWRRPDSWICSELLAAGLEACGWFPKPLVETPNELTPRDLLLLVGSWGQ